MTEKNENLYTAVFNYLTNNQVIFPKHIIIDFEQVSINSTTTFTSLISNHGCIFSLCTSALAKNLKI